MDHNVQCEGDFHDAIDVQPGHIGFLLVIFRPWEAETSPVCRKNGRCEGKSRQVKVIEDLVEKSFGCNDQTVKDSWLGLLLRHGSRGQVQRLVQVLRVILDWNTKDDRIFLELAIVCGGFELVFSLARSLCTSSDSTLLVWRIVGIHRYQFQIRGILFSN